MMESLFPLAGGGLVGFCVGYFLKKLLKFILIGAGAVLLLLGYLEYHRWITANWTTIEAETQTTLNHWFTTLGTVTQNMGHEIPIGLGLVGFVPGLVIGLAKG